MADRNLQATAKDARKKRKSARRVFLVDDHPIVLSGLSRLVDQEDDLTVCGGASGAAEALSSVQEARPDIVLLDISLDDGNGLELARTLQSECPDVFLLVLSMHDESIYAERALRAGARGYVMKQEAPEMVLDAIRTVLQGEMYLSPRMTSTFLKQIVNSGREQGRVGVKQLSDRELEVFQLVGQGLATREIAERLHLSVKTVETHRSRTKAKLGLVSSSELTHHAVHWEQMHSA